MYKLFGAHSKILMYISISYNHHICYNQANIDHYFSQDDDEIAKETKYMEKHLKEKLIQCITKWL